MELDHESLDLLDDEAVEDCASQDGVKTCAQSKCHGGDRHGT